MSVYKVVPPYFRLDLWVSSKMKMMEQLELIFSCFCFLLFVMLALSAVSSSFLSHYGCSSAVAV